MCGFLLGSLVEEKTKHRKEDICDLLTALDKMKRDIVFLSLPIDRIYQELSGKCRVGKMFERISLSGEKNQEKLWEENLNILGTLKNEDMLPILSLAKELGKGDRELSGRQIDICMEILKKNLEKVENACNRECKLYPRLGLYGGILIIILMM